MKIEFVAKQRGAWPVNMMCEVLGVSRSGFCAWLGSVSTEPAAAQARDFMRNDRLDG